MRSVRRATTVLALSVAALLGTAGVALACHSGDGRGKPVEGGVSDCGALHQSGLDHGDVTFAGGEGEKTLTIAKLGEGVKVTAIVVQGGEGADVYHPGQLGLKNSPEWSGLVAPYDKHGNEAKIDSWFLCGTKETKPTETAPAPTSTSSKPTAKPTETSTSDTPDSTTAAAPAGGSQNTGGTGNNLASTGFDNAWLIWIALALLLAGGGLLALLKLRRRTS